MVYSAAADVVDDDNAGNDDDDLDKKFIDVGFLTLNMSTNGC